VFAGIATLVLGFVYITDMFAGDEVGVIVSYLFTLAIGLLYIFKEEDHYVGPDYSKKLRKAKPRRALISDDQYQYWPHSPLPEKSTVYEKLRRLSWIAGISMLWPLVLSVLIGFSYPDEPGLAEVQLMGAIACGFFFTIAYSEQLFIGGDH
jgi:hypothetical protein